jgi:tetratricopeptide (TPR) repeat protein
VRAWARLVDDAVALHERALSAYDDHRFRDVLRLCRLALGAFERCCGPDHPDVANVVSLLARAEDEVGAHARAGRHHRRAVRIMTALPAAGGDLARLRLHVRVGLAGHLRRRGRYGPSGGLLRAVLRTAEAAPGYGPLDLAPIWNELGVLYKFSGRLDDARRLYERAYGVLGAVWGPRDVRLAGLCHNLAGVAHGQGRFAEAEAWALRSLELHTRGYPPDHPAVVADRAHLAVMLLARGSLTEAEPLLRHAIAFFTRRYGPHHYEVAVNLHNLAAVRAGLGDLAGAERLYRRALRAKRAALGAAHPEVAVTLHDLSRVVAERR